MSDLIGSRLSLSVTGTSHGPEVRATLRGLPAGFAVDTEALRRFLLRRAPGQSPLTSARREADEPEFLSGLPGGVTDGTPLTVRFANADAHPADYKALRDRPRPSHADYPARVRFGEGEDLRGGGRFSGRLTAPLCAAGGIALQMLAARGITVGAHLAAVAGIEDTPFDPVGLSADTLCAVAARTPPVQDEAAGERMLAAVAEAAAAGDSVGGVVECAAVGLPVGLGDALFGGAESRLAAALFGIPAVKGVEFGAGFAAAAMRGSAHNDPYAFDGDRVVTLSNNAGGLLGGMTTGMPLILRAACKPTPSIALPQQTVDLGTRQPATLTVCGRHDPCVALRAAPAVEAATALILLDMLLEVSP